LKPLWLAPHKNGYHDLTEACLEYVKVTDDNYQHAAKETVLKRLMKKEPVKKINTRNVTKNLWPNKMGDYGFGSDVPHRSFIHSVRLG
jgi:hypothetical protein